MKIHVSLIVSGLIDWLIDWCFTVRQHKIGQFEPIYQGNYWLRV